MVLCLRHKLDLSPCCGLVSGDRSLPPHPVAVRFWSLPSVLTALQRLIRVLELI